MDSPSIIWPLWSGTIFATCAAYLLMDNYHLVPHGGRWRLTTEGGDHILGDFATKDEALGDCAAIVRDNSGSLKIHHADGTIEEERTYPRAADPATSPG
jgi:hypothetical protein